MAVSGNPLRIVVFGGIGSGKTTVSGLLQERGAHVIEADRLGHRVLEPDGAAFDAVAARWPDVVVDGRIDRPALGAIVFADRAALEELEQLTHPHIRAAISGQVAAAGGSPVVLELPIVRDWVDREWIWILVDAPVETRIERSVARGSGREDVTARIDAQPTPAEYHDAADWIIPNAGTEAELESAVGELWERLTP